MCEYMKVRGPYKTDNEAFFVLADGSPVKPSQIRDILKLALIKLNLQHSLYTVHSIRAGRATEMVRRFGYSIDEVKTRGRWRSSAVYRYLKF